MADVAHSNLVAPDAIHPAGYIATTDPGAVGVGKLWIDTSTSAPYQLKKRNALNTGWDLVGMGAGAATFTGEVSAPDFKSTGLTGATSGARFVGATASGAPVSGTFVAGDVVIDLTGSWWFCTVGGTPGTWVHSFVNPMTTQGDLIFGGASGAPTRLAPSTVGYLLSTNGSGANPSWIPAPSGGGGTGGGGSSPVAQLLDYADNVDRSATLVTNTWTDISGNPAFTVTDPSAIILIEVNGVVHGSNGVSTGFATRIVIDSGGTPILKSLSGGHSSTQNNVLGGTGPVTFTGLATGSHTVKVQLNSFTAAMAFTAGFATNPTTDFLQIRVLQIPTTATLLTSNSNLIQETVLTAAQASIPIPNIPQGYRDLRIEVVARSDAVASNVSLSLQANGDTGTNYQDSVSAITGSSVAAGGSTAVGLSVGNIDYVIPGANAPANYFGKCEIRCPDYSRVTTGFKLFSGTAGAVALTATTGNEYHNVGMVQWLSTAAITSLLLSLSSGNFITGTVVRVYGEPAAAAGPSVGTGTRLRISGNQSIPAATATVVTWDTEDNDADNQHYTSAANLTGTVAKTAASAALVGTGTAFTTELSIGQVISVPGTAAEVAVVIAITDATHLTVAKPFANTASAQTATRVNSAVIFRQPGFYQIEVGSYWPAATGAVSVQIRLNGATIVASNGDSINAENGVQCVCLRNFQQWDYVEVLVTQSNGAAINLLADERTHLALSSKPTVTVAVPYVNIQDQKASGTAGGTFTSGAFQTRALNTVVNDSAGISSLASNQVTLPPGTYRCRILSPAYQVNHHQARLQNTTDAATLLTGTNASSGATSNSMNSSEITGRFTLTGTKVLEVQHRCETTGTTNGFGSPGSWGTEVYTVAEFWKEG